MNYEEKYKEALERAKEIWEKSTEQTELSKATVEMIFPELKESEDERIRKKVIEVLKLNIRGAETQMQASRGVDRCFEIYACNKVIAWLEKQGKMLNADEVIEWLETNAADFGESPCNPNKIIEQFKKDFKL